MLFRCAVCLFYGSHPSVPQFHRWTPAQHLDILTTGQLCGVVDTGLGELRAWVLQNQRAVGTTFDSGGFGAPTSAFADDGTGPLCAKSERTDNV